MLLNIAVVGCGFMGSLHARVVASLPNARLVGVVDVDKDRAGRLATEVGCDAYSDLDALFSARSPQGVIVATPDQHHRDPVIAASDHGCGVLVEKPLAVSLDDADAMIKACDSAGVPLMVGHILRFETAYAQLKDAVEEGFVGRLVSAFARRHALQQEAERLAHRTSVIRYLAIHDFDQIAWIHPGVVTKVRATEAKGPVFEKFGTPDVVFTTLEFDNGAAAVVESGWSLTRAWGDWDTPSTWGPFGDVRFDVTGSDGFLSLDLRTMNLIGVDRKQGWRAAETRHWPTMHGRITGALKAEIEHFLACLYDGSTPLSNGRTALPSVQWCVAAQRSLEEDKPVNPEKL